MERWFSLLEAKAVPILRAIDESRELPHGKAMAILIAFVALQANRTHRIRETFESAFDEMSKMSLRMILSSKERWEMNKERMKQAGAAGEEMDSVSYTEMLDFAQREEFRSLPGRAISPESR